jgi:hypothetical protein
MAKKRLLYPYADDHDRIYDRKLYATDEEPDFIGGAPNWDKFEAWDIDEVLVWLNID